MPSTSNTMPSLFSQSVPSISSISSDDRKRSNMEGVNSEEDKDGAGTGGFAAAGGIGDTGAAGFVGAGEGRDTAGGATIGGVIGLGAAAQTGSAAGGLTTDVSGADSFFGAVAAAGALSLRSCFSSRSSAYNRAVRSAHRD